MPVTLLFVHGTGVRAKGYAATLEVVRAQVAAHDLPLEVTGCFWGEAEGARLRANGASIPGYDKAGGAPPTEDDLLLALWIVLYSDPWYELRLLRHRVVGAIAFGQEPPSVLLRRAVDAYVPSDELRERFAQAGLEPFLDDALQRLRAAPELDDAVATAPADPLEHRRALGRAIVAATLVAAEDCPTATADTPPVWPSRTRMVPPTRPGAGRQRLGDPLRSRSAGSHSIRSPRAG